MWGFVSGRSTSDAIFFVDRIRETCVEYRRKKVLTLADFTKAFDKLNRAAIIRCVELMGTDSCIIWRTATILNNTKQY